MERKTLRLPLIDILGKDTEEDVIYILQEIKKGLLFEFNILMWYRDKAICNDAIKAFEKTYVSEIASMNICVKHLNGYEDYIWYDIINTVDAVNLKKFKFRLVYNTYTHLPTSLLEFSSFAKSYNKNGNRNDKKNSNNGFSNVGRPNKN